MNKRYRAVVLNFMAPGLGQCSIGHWRRGLIQFFSAGAGFVMAAWAVLYPLVSSVYRMLDDVSSNDELVDIQWPTVILGLLLFCIAFGWSILDLLLFSSQKRNKTAAS